MKKATFIEYDPYGNKLDFRISHSADGEWHSLGETSELRQYMDRTVLFSNCASDIVRIVNTRQNTDSDGLEIRFCGPDGDFALLEKVVSTANSQERVAGKLTCKQVGSYMAAPAALETIKKAYRKIASEFEDYLPGKPNYEGEGRAIGERITNFEKTMSSAVPICMIGNYSVGKSALINALIGEEVLPSKENPSTAKNVEVRRSRRYAVTVEFERDDGIRERAVLGISPGRLYLTEDEQPDSGLVQDLLELVDTVGKTETEIIYGFIDLLNSPPADSTGATLKDIGWNVTVELPLRESMLSSPDSDVVFYDTPGSDNDTLDHLAHSQALEGFMGSQTNGLPILVTTRGKLVSKDTAEIRRMLDRYADNFASPCCLVVIAQCDTLNKSKLEEGIPADIKNWHGKTVVLYTTAVGALGIKKGSGSSWTNVSYQEDFDAWQRREACGRRVTLPDYNIYPCEERNILDSSEVDDEMYATGIPSLEYEILHYVKNFSDYKKCARGKDDLVKAIAAVRDLLEEKEGAAKEARALAAEKQAEERQRLIGELETISLPGPQGIAEHLLPDFEGDLDEYCSELPKTLEPFYDEASMNSSPLKMDEEVNDRIRAHCQAYLIDVCYKRPGGARDKIKEALVGQATAYVRELQRYVDANDSHLSDTAKARLHDYLDNRVEAPTFKEVDSILDEIAEVFAKAALVPHEILKLANDPERARRDWIEAKSKQFEQKLHDRNGPFGKSLRGLFYTTLLERPVGQYYRQLEEWALEYRRAFEDELNSGNAVLSGLEAEIENLDNLVGDLRSRLQDISDVEENLSGVLERKGLGDGEGR